MEITRRLTEAGDLLGIKVLDHIIIGDSYLSFAEQGYL
jgi:DNA repair protein RadC